MPTLVRTSITPLKSTALHHPERVVLGPGGVAENRRFFICDATQRDPDAGERDLETLRTIGAYRGRSGARTLDFGVCGVVAAPGPVAVGDAVTLLEG